MLYMLIKGPGVMRQALGQDLFHVNPNFSTINIQYIKHQTWIRD